VAEVIIETFKKRENIKGLEIEYEVPKLKHFTVKLKEIE